MRIGVDIRALMEGKITGIEVYVVNLLRSLFELDRTNQYVLFANCWSRISLPNFDYPNVELKITRYPNKLFNFLQKIGFPKIESLIGPVDIFFSPHWRITALKRDTPLVVTFHDLFFEIMPEFFTFRRWLWHGFMNYPRAARRAEKIIAVSESTKKDIEDIYGINRDKIKVIYPGVPPLPSPPHEGEGRRGRNYFLYFGTFEPRKNVEAVLAAYQEYFIASPKKFPLVMAGSSGWKTAPRVPLHLRQMITVKKNVSEQEKARLYDQAVALLFPSYYEGFGFPILEAGSRGVPVIASFTTSLAEVGRDFVLAVNPFRASQIALAMLALEQDKGYYENLKRRGLETASRFTWDAAARSTLKLFGEIKV